MLNLRRNTLDNGILELEVQEDGTKLTGKQVVRPSPHIGSDLFSTMSKCYQGQRHRETDNPQFVQDD